MLILFGLLLKKVDDRATNCVMTQHEVNAHLTINANALCQMKNGVCYYVKCNFFLQMKMQSFLYENITNTSPSKPNASTMQNAMMHNDAKKQIFLYFLNKNEIIKQKNDSTTPKLCKHYQTTLTQSTKVKET